MSIKIIILLGLVAIAMGSIIGDRKRITVSPNDITPNQKLGSLDDWFEVRPFPPIRRTRSSEGGSVNVKINQNDKTGTSGSVNAKQNIWSSKDGNTKVDFNGGATKNFNHGNSDANVAVSVDHKWGK